MRTLRLWTGDRHNHLMRCLRGDQRRRTSRLGTGLLLLACEERLETNTRDLDDLETNTGNITLGLTGTTETRDEHLVVLVDKVETTVVGDESGDLLAVLDQLDTHTLSDSRVRLLGLDTDLLENDALGLGRTSGGRGLVEVAEGTLLELSVGLLSSNEWNKCGMRRKRSAT